MTELRSMVEASTDGLLGDHLVAVVCSCGRTLLSASRFGLIAQVASHWRLRHTERIVVTPEEFVVSHEFFTWEGD